MHVLRPACLFYKKNRYPGTDTLGMVPGILKMNGTFTTGNKDLVPCQY